MSYGSLSSSSTWTAKQNKLFENGLAIFDKETPDRWDNIASMVGDGKSVEDVKRHYNVLVEDLKLIESGQIPIPNYKPISSSTAKNKSSHFTDDNNRR